MKMHIFLVPFFLRVSFQGAGRRIRRFFRAVCRLGVAVLLDAVTILRVTRAGLFLVLVALDAARTLLTILCTLLRIRWWRGMQPMLWGTWTLLLLLHDVGRTVVTIICSNSRIRCWRPLLSRGIALNCLNSLNSLICHPSMHAPSLARVFDGKNGGVSGMVSGEGVGGGSRGRDTARLDALLHDVIRSVPACGNPRIQGLPEYYDCSYARWSTSSNSRLERGSELRGGTKWFRRGSLCKVRQDAGELQEPQLEDFPGAGNQGKVCCVGFPPWTPFVTRHSCATWARQ